MREEALARLLPFKGQQMALPFGARIVIPDPVALAFEEGASLL